MSWWRDRRGYGELRLPYRRRVERRQNWLDTDLRRRRRGLLKRNWQDLTKISGAFAVSIGAFSFVLREHPLVQVGVIGLFVGLAIVSTLVFLALMDCSLLSRFGRWVEELVGDELRTSPGVYGVISNLPVDSVDVDHVVLTPEGVHAIEVKAYLVGQHSLDRTYDLPRERSQAARGAAAVREVLLQADLDVPVRAVVVLAGPGAPPMAGPDERGRVRVAAFRRTGEWRPPAISEMALDRALAARVADALLAHRRTALTGSGPSAGTRPVPPGALRSTASR